MSAGGTNSKRSWRMETGSAVATKVQPQKPKLLITLVAIGLVVALGAVLMYLLRNPRSSQLVLAATKIEYLRGKDVRTRRLLPPLAYSTKEFSFVPAGQFISLNRAENWQTSFRDQLGKLPGTERDVLMYLVRAHCVVRNKDGKRIPYLLTGRETESEKGEIAVSEVVSELARATPTDKILVLNCGDVAFDPGQGVLWTDFAAAVQAELKGMKAGNLWVILSQSSLQQATPVLETANSSYFSQWLADALAGAANVEDQGRTDRWVTLAEVMGYLQRTAERSFPRQPPLPILLKAGQGEVRGEQLELAKQLKLTYIPAKSSAKAEAATTAVAGAMQSALPSVPGEVTTATETAKAVNEVVGSAPPDTKQSTESKKVEPKTADTKDAVAKEAATKDEGKKDIAPKEAITKDVAPAPVAKSPAPSVAANSPAMEDLAQAWQLRDELEQRGDQNYSMISSSGAPKWRPLDIAPHLWRELNGDLIDIALRSTESANATDVAADARQLRERLKVIQNLVGPQGDSANGADDDVELRAWLAAARDFRAGLAKRANSLSADDQASLWPVDRALQLLHQAHFELPAWLHWQARATLMGTNLELTPAKQLLAACQRVEDVVQNLSGKPFTAVEAAQLERATAEIARARASLFETLQDQIDAQRDRLRRDVRMKQLLLSTPLVSASQRRQLLSLPVITAEETSSDVPLVKLAPPQLARALGPTAGLELRWLARWLPKESDKLRTLAGTLDRDPTPDQLEAAGASFTEVLWSLTQSSVGSTPASNNSGSNWHPSYLLAVDGRQARLVPNDISPATSLVSIAAAPQAPRLVADLQPETFEVRVDDPTSQAETVLRVASSGQNAQEAVLRAKFNDRFWQLTAVDDGSSRPIGWDQPIRLPLNSQGQATLKLRIGMLPNVDAASLPANPEISLMVKAGDLESSLLLPGKLKSERLELVLRRLGSEDYSSPVGEPKLRPFPNRATQFEMFVENYTGESKQVVVELYSVPELKQRTWPVGRVLRRQGREFRLQPEIEQRMFITRSDVPDWKLKSEIQPIARTEVTVGANDKGSSRKLVSFPPPPAPAKPADGAPAPAPAPPPKLDFDATHGLLAVLTEGTNRKLYWLEVAPLHPLDYLASPQAVNATPVLRLLDRDDEKRWELALNFKPAFQATSVFPQLAELPLALKLRCKPEKAGKLGDSLKDATRIGLLYVQTSTEEPLSLEIDVDGYPRALRFVTKKNVARAGLPPEASEKVEFARVQVLPPPPVAGSPAPPPPPDAQQFEIRDKQGNRFPMFGIGKLPGVENSEPITLKFHVAVDSGTLPEREPSGSFQLSTHKTTLPEDRRITTRGEIRDERFLTLTSRITDIELSEEFTELNHAVPASLGWGQAQQTVWVLRDSKPPMFNDINPPGKVLKGQPISFTVDVSDVIDLENVEGVSGKIATPVRQLEWGLEKDGEPPAKFIPISLEGRQGNQIAVQLETSKDSPTKWKIYLRATDFVGNQSLEMVEARVEDPPPPKVAAADAPKAEEKKVVLGVITGRIHLTGGNEVAPSSITVKLSGPESRSKELSRDARGVFRFDQLKPGKYTIQVDATDRGKSYSGTKQDVVPSDPKSPEAIDFPLK